MTVMPTEQPPITIRKKNSLGTYGAYMSMFALAIPPACFGFALFTGLLFIMTLTLIVIVPGYNALNDYAFETLPFVAIQMSMVIVALSVPLYVGGIIQHARQPGTYGDGRKTKFGSVFTLTAIIGYAAYVLIVQHKTEATAVRTQRQAQNTAQDLSIAQDHMRNISNALFEYTEKEGVPPEFSSSFGKKICKLRRTCDGISLDFLVPAYLPDLPFRITTSVESDVTGYELQVNPTGAGIDYTVSAPDLRIGMASTLKRR